MVNITYWVRNVSIENVCKFDNLFFPLWFAVKRTKSRTTDDWGVVAWELVFVEEFTNFHFNEVEEFFVVYHVALIEEYNDVWYTYLTSEKDVFTSLWHRTISCSYYEDCAVHLCSTSDHVLYIVSVAWAVNVCVVTLFSVVFYVRGVDGNTTSLFFWSVIDLIECTSLTAELLS